MCCTLWCDVTPLPCVLPPPPVYTINSHLHMCLYQMTVSQWTACTTQRLTSRV